MAFHPLCIAALIALTAAASCSPSCGLLNHNGRCDTACNTSICQYDKRECIPNCSSACLTASIGNGVCDPLCNTPECLNDNKDCVGKCTNDCFLWMLGDGKCQPQCNNIWCQYDAGECPCITDMLFNGVCDSICQSAAFDFDAGDCAEFIYVNATAPSETGSGTLSDPYRSLTKALTHPFKLTQVGVCFLPGSHLLTRPDPPLLWFTVNVTHAFITCKFCVSCQGTPELLVVDQQPAIFLATNVTTVILENMRVSGIQLLKRGCADVYCAYCLPWECNSTFCSSSFRHVVPLEEVPQPCRGLNCFLYNSSVFQFNATSTVIARNLVFDTVTGAKSVLVANSTDILVYNVTVLRAELQAHAVVLTGQKPVTTTGMRVKSASALHFVLVSAFTGLLTCTVQGLEVVGLNEYFTGDTVCVSTNLKPGALKVTDFLQASVSNVTVERVLGGIGRDITYSDYAVVSLDAVEEASVSFCTFSLVSIQGSALGIFYKPTNFRADTRIHAQADSVTVSDSLFFNGSAVYMSSTELSASAVLKNLTVLHTVGTAVRLETRGNSLGCEDFVVPEISAEAVGRRTSALRQVRVEACAPLSAALLDLAGVCNVEVEDASIVSSALEVPKLLQDAMAARNAAFLKAKVMLSDGEKTTLGELLACSSGLVRVIEAVNTSLSHFAVAENACDRSSLFQLNASSSVTLRLAQFTQNRAEGALLSIRNTTHSVLQDSELRANREQSGVLWISESSAIEVKQSSFDSNLGVIAGGLYIDSAEVAVSTVSFRSGIASSGAGITLTTSLSPVRLKLIDCTFENSTADSGRDLAIADERGLGVDLWVFRSRFQYGSTASLMSVLPGTLLSALVEETVFQDAEGKDFKGVFTLQYAAGELNFRNSTFTRCRSADPDIGSIVYADIGSLNASLRFSGCTFERNSAAVLVSLPNEYVKQSAVFEHSTFSDNRAQVMDIIYASVAVRNCTFRGNENSEVLIARLLFSSVLDFSDSQVVSTRSASALFSLSEMSSLAISTANFTGNVAAWALAIVTNSDFHMRDSQYSGNKVIQGPLFLVQTSIVTIDNCITHDNSPSESHWDMQTSNLTVFSLLTFNETSDIFVMKLVHAKIAQIAISRMQRAVAVANECELRISDISAEDVGTLIKLTSSQLTVERVRVHNCSTVLAAHDSQVALLMSWLEGMNSPLVLAGSTLSIANSQFLRNRGCVYGTDSVVQILKSRFEESAEQSAIRLIDCDLYTEDTVFKDNEAIEGAALHLQCPSLNCNYTLAKTAIRDNVAVRGAAIFYIEVGPMLVDTILKNNTAEYGSEFGTIPWRLVNVSEFPEAVSGSIYSFPILQLIDRLGQVMTADNSSSVQIFVSDGIILKGNSRNIAQKGSFTISGLSLTSTPGQAVELQAVASAVPPLNISLSFRLCEVGEILESDFSCRRCAPLTYSLNLDDRVCSQCPVGALCYGGAEVFPLPGYWRSSNSSDLFYTCGKACLGSPDRSNPTGACAEGYYSNLCGTCKPQHFRFAATLCKLCPKRSVNVVVSLVLFLIYVAFLAKIVAGSISRTEKSKTALHLKLVMNYLQVTMMLTEFNLEWPDLLLEIFHTSAVAGNSSQAMFAIDCFADLSSGDFVYVKHIVVSLMPLAQMGASCMIWGGVAVVRGNRKYFRDHNISTIISLLLLLHSTLTSSVLSLFACRTLDNGTWLLEDLTVRCWQGQHSFFVLTLGIPSLVIWVFGFPLAVLAVLVGSRLDSQQNKLRYGFLYSGYERRFFYWETVVIARKVAVKGVSVVLSHAQDMQRVMTANTVIVTMLSLQVAYRPYEDLRVNHIEAMSMAANFVTLTLGAFFGANMSFAAQQVLIWSIVGVNVAFLLHWARSLAVASQVCWRLRRRGRVTAAPTDLEHTVCKREDDSSLSPIY